MRCHTGGCSRGVVLTHLEAAVGLPIWAAYAPVSEAAVKAPEKLPWWKRKRVVVAGVVAGVVALVVAAPLITGEVDVFALNLVGLGIGALLLQAVPRAAHGAEAQTLTRGGRLLSHTHPNTQGSSPAGGGSSSLPEGRNPKATQHEGGRDDNGNIGNWQSDDGDGGKAPAQPRRAGRPAHGGAVLGAAGDGTGDGDTLSVAKSVHEARRLRQTGDVEGALAVLAGMDTTKAEAPQARWAYAEWTDLVRRRFGDRDALVYSQGAGRAA